MSLVFEKHLSPNTKLALWRVSESLDELPEKAKRNILGIKNSKRRRELVGRYLLMDHLGISEEVAYENNGKPIIEGGYISISHDGDMVFIGLSDKAIGIDIQRTSRKLEIIKTKYCNPHELTMVDKSNNRLILLTLIWAAKEAVFKIYGKGLPFSEGMTVGQVACEEPWEQEGKLRCALRTGRIHHLSYFRVEDYFLMITAD